MTENLIHENSNASCENIENQKITTKNSYLRSPNDIIDSVFVNETHISLAHCRDINSQTFFKA